MYGVLMAGGKGTRFWPQSRADRPKQLLNIIGETTMLQATVARILPVIPPENIYVVTGEDIEVAVREQLPDIPGENILVEPCARNTAPCIGMAAVVIQRRDPGGVMAVLPADHLIQDEEAFRRVLRTAGEMAGSTKYLLTLGITPTRAETGYGHIHRGARLGERDGQPFFAVERFVEKPDLERAKAYTESGQYLWNSGMFIWSVPAILGAMDLHLHDLHAGLMTIGASLGTSWQEDTLREVYRSAASISIDYGIMEHAEGVVVIPCQFGWNDVGSWASLEEVHRRDENGNTILCPFVGIDTTRSIILSRKKLVATIGLDNMIVVDTPDALLICPKERAQEVRKIVERLQDEGLDDYV